MLSLAAATLVHYLVEVPGERWLRAVLKKAQPPEILGPLPARVDQRGQSQSVP
jgi:peptidoglycan/LPS O-acetylase OafA/YrhL